MNAESIRQWSCAKANEEWIAKGGKKASEEDCGRAHKTRLGKVREMMGRGIRKGKKAPYSGKCLGSSPGVPGVFHGSFFFSH